jgi:hypothetical protein
VASSRLFLINILSKAHVLSRQKILGSFFYTTPKGNFKPGLSGLPRACDSPASTREEIHHNGIQKIIKAGLVALNRDTDVKNNKGWAPSKVALI